MNSAVILLGSNIGDAINNLERAIGYIEENAGIVTKYSLIYETEPWGKKNQANFLNRVIEISTTYNAVSLLNILLDIEERLGRRRAEKWAARLIDLDILYFNNDIISEDGLKIPHPHLHERRFTMQPLCDILPGFVHPVIGKTNKEILKMLKDDTAVKSYDPAIQSKGL